MKLNDAPIIIISGNRSGDMDSLVTSYVKSRLLKLINPHKEIFVIRYFTEQQWKLHRDVKFLFDQCDGDILVYKHPNELIEKWGAMTWEIYLTDHNLLEPELKEHLDSVVEITDHHKILKPIPSGIRQNIDHTGSCSTLISEEFLTLAKTRPDLFTDELITTLAEMLYFTIRTDTDHLPDNGQYNLDRDKKVLDRLKPLIKKSPDFLNAIKKEKYNIQGFDVEDHLTRDYKVWHLPRIAYGISTIHHEIESFFPLLHKDPLAPLRYIEKNKLNILFLMHFNKEPILKRELTVICTESCPFKDELIKEITDSPHFEMKNGDELGYVRFFQHDPHFSRKKIQPYLDQLLKKLIKDTQ